MKSSQIYRLIDLERFPAPVPLTGCARRWLVHEIVEWLRGREALSLQISGKRNPPGRVTAIVRAFDPIVAREARLP